MEFKRKLKQRLLVAVSYIVLGLVLILADAVNHFNNYYFFSFGLTLVILGVLRIFKYRKITRDDKTIRRQELTETDERIRMISERAKSWAFSFSILIAGIAVIVLSLMGYHDEALPYAWYVCGQVILYWIFWLILRKKY